MSKATLVGDRKFNTHISVVVIGGGACGLTAALKAHDAGSEVIVLERDKSATGSTAMSSGFIPAPGTRCQLEAALADHDSPEIFADDILTKSKGTSDVNLVRWSTRSIGPVLNWLESDHGLEWVLLDEFLYPGHIRHRMHAVPEKTGVGLMTRLTAAVETAGIPLLTSAHVTELLMDDDAVRGVAVDRPDGTTEVIGCDAVILACNGYGGNRELVARHIPDMANAPYYGHVGNQGEAILWGQALNAELKHLSGCQGHGSLSHPHGILITWALMMEGGIQINMDGLRFSNEHQGYSEQSISVLAQPGAIAWSVFDERLYQYAQSFPDFQEANAAGAVRTAASLADLATAISVPFDALAATMNDLSSFTKGKRSDPFGRNFTTKPPLQTPYYAVQVTGALFHTQGGLMINESARVLRRDGTELPNLFAAGGAACGVSGPNIDGYLSGNGLLTAIAFGAAAGQAAAKLVS